MTLRKFAFSCFERYADGFLRRLKLDRALRRGGVRTYAPAYASMMLFSTMFATPVSAVGVLLTLKFGLPFLALVFAPAFVFLAYYAYPFIKASERNERLTPEVPFTVAYMSVMGAGGLSPYESFKRLTRADLLPASRAEARRMVYEVEVVGEDPLTVFKEQAEENPSKPFAGFMRGYVDTTITGGDVRHYLQVKVEETLRAEAARLKESAERLVTILESYMIVSVMLGIVFYVMWIVGRMFGGMGGSELTFSLYAFVGVPLFSTVFYILIALTQPRRPFIDWGPYKVAALSLLIGVTTFALLSLLWLFDVPTCLGISALAFSLPPAVAYSRSSREARGVEKGMTAFLRDYTEARKAGLSPERAIAELSKNNYGRFSKHLKRMNWLIETGVPTREAVQIFIKRAGSWMAKVYAFLLIETIDVGGAGVATSEELARFASSVEEIEREKRAATKVTVAIPYIMIGMFILTVKLLARLLTGVTLPSLGGITRLGDILALSVTLNAICAGLITGKGAEESMAAGFKHVFGMVLLCLIVTFASGVIWG